MTDNTPFGRGGYKPPSYLTGHNEAGKSEQWGGGMREGEKKSLVAPRLGNEGNEEKREKKMERRKGV